MIGPRRWRIGAGAGAGQRGQDETEAGGEKEPGGFKVLNGGGEVFSISSPGGCGTCSAGWRWPQTLEALEVSVETDLDVMALQFEASHGFDPRPGGLFCMYLHVLPVSALVPLSPRRIGNYKLSIGMTVSLDGHVPSSVPAVN